jgi:hypothetical protein
MIFQLKSSAIASTNGRPFPFSSSERMACIRRLFSDATIAKQAIP